MKFAVVAGLLISACASVPAIGARTVLNREDFVWDAKFSPDGRQVAISRLTARAYVVSLFEDGQPRGDVTLNSTEDDVEALEFSPDGRTLATVSRDGALRLIRDRAVVAQWLTEEPLVSVAWNVDGSMLALKSAKGLVTVLAFPSLRHVTELRAHADEVRGLAFTTDGRLISGSWDQTLQVFTLDETTANEVRTHMQKRGVHVSFRAVLDHKASADVAIDARMPMLVVKNAFAASVGLQPTDETRINSVAGPQVVKVAHGQSLSVKGLQLDGLDVAVCDACVPEGVSAVLGGPALDHVAYDEATQEVVLTGPLVKTRSLTRIAAHRFPAAVNDFSLDAAGRVVGVAFSETKAQRTRDVYDREKRGEVEPMREWDCAARVDVQSGVVLSREHVHRGVVSTVGISPDGQHLVSGGWDKRVVFEGRVDASYGWSIRRVRFSNDGRRIIVAAWTPQNGLGDRQSDPSAVIYVTSVGVPDH